MDFIKWHDLSEKICQLVDRIPINPVAMLAVYMFLFWPAASFSMGMVTSGEVCVSPTGFAVDSSGLVYIGQTSVIKVYKDNEVVNTIYPMTDRGYGFTIQNDDTILLSTSSTVYTLDLNGNELSRSRENVTQIMNELQTNRKHFQSANGDRYTMYGFLRPITIVRNGDETVYKMSTGEYMIKLLYIFSYGSLVIFIPLIAIKWRRTYPNGYVNK